MNFAKREPLSGGHSIFTASPLCPENHQPVVFQPDPIILAMLKVHVTLKHVIGLVSAIHVIQDHSTERIESDVS